MKIEKMRGICFVSIFTRNRSDKPLSCATGPQAHPGSIGPVFEIRTYLYRPGEIPKVLDAWENAIETREKYSSLVGCWYSDIGELNKLIHIWAYNSLEERSKIRSEVVERGVWPPKSGISPTSQENKIVLPFEFSPIR